MKLKRLEKISRNKKKIILGTIAILCSLGIGLLLGKTFSLYQVSKSFEFVNGKVNYYGKSDVYFAFYNGDTWLEEMPKKGNNDNLVYDHAVCDNEAEIEWDEDKWALKVLNLTKTKTRCALYFEIYISTAVEDIINLAKSDTTNLTYDGTTENNLRYIGTTPDNYVTFNDELWRIIGVMNNIKTTESGAGESRLKIIRNSSLDQTKMWDEIEYQSGKNNWARPATLNTYLQSLSIASNSLIDDAVWNIGAGYSADNTAKTFYTQERSSSGSGALSSAIKWTGKVGLLYPSDYGFAVGGTVRDTCLQSNLSSYNYGNCTNNNWLKKNIDYWMLTPNRNTSTEVYFFDSRNYLNKGNVISKKSIYPVVYLKSSVRITGGSGTTDSPYTLSL